MTTEDASPDAVSIDRIDRTQGYYPENVRLVCRFVNNAIRNWDDATLYRFVNALYTNRKSGSAN